MKHIGIMNKFSDRKITSKVIFVFVVSLILAVSFAVGEAIMSYREYNLHVSQEQSTYSLNALDGRLDEQKQSVLNDTVLLSQTYAVVSAMETQNGAMLNTAITEAAKNTDLEYITVTDSHGTVLLNSAQTENKTENLPGIPWFRQLSREPVP